jgi:quercetin dioxygenase-like cupin family protein
MVIAEKRTREELQSAQSNKSASEERDPTKDIIGKFDFPALISQVKSGEAWKSRERNAITLTRTSGLQITLIAMHSGTFKPWHRVECPISLQVIEGKIDFITDAETVALKTGGIIVLQKGVRHHMKAIDESFVLLTLGTELNRLAG